MDLPRRGGSVFMSFCNVQDDLGDSQKAIYYGLL